MQLLCSRYLQKASGSSHKSVSIFMFHLDLYLWTTRAASWKRCDAPRGSYVPCQPLCKRALYRLLNRMHLDCSHAWESNFPTAEMRREVECFPVESPQCRKRSAAAHVQCSARGRAPSGRCTFMLVTSLLTFRQRHTVRAVMQRTHAAQLSNFDNALLCSAFKFLLYQRSLSAFLHFSRSDHDWKMIQIIRCAVAALEMHVHCYVLSYV